MNMPFDSQLKAGVRTLHTESVAWVLPSPCPYVGLSEQKDHSQHGRQSTHKSVSPSSSASSSSPRLLISCLVIILA